MKFLAGLSIAFVLSVFCPPDIQGSISLFDYHALTVSPSARINGMGEAGVALVDQQSTWYNPASLGFLAGTHRFTAAFFPIRSRYLGYRVNERNLQFLTATGSLVRQQGELHSPISIGVSVYRTDLYLPTGTGILHRTTVDAVSLGISRNGDIEYGAGITYKSVNMRIAWIDWDNPFDQIKGDAFDLGFMIGLIVWPRYATESVGRTGLSLPFKLGMSWSNLGGGLERQDGAELDYGPLARIRRTGMSLGMIHTSDGFEDVSVLLALDYEQVLDPILRAQRKPRTLHLGIELSMEQVVILRAGVVNREGRDDSFSTGLTLSSKGMARPTNAVGETSAGGLGNLFKKLVVELSAAYYPRRSDPMYRSAYASLDIQWLY